MQTMLKTKDAARDDSNMLTAKNLVSLLVDAKEDLTKKAAPDLDISLDKYMATYGDKATMLKVNWEAWMKRLGFGELLNIFKYDMGDGTQAQLKTLKSQLLLAIRTANGDSTCPCTDASAIETYLTARLNQQKQNLAKS